MRRTVGAAGLMLAAAACVAPVPGTPFGPERVQSELVGKTWHVTLPNGAPATEHFNADGTVRITGGLNDSGRWRLWERGYCTAWNRMRSGAERCFTLDRTEDGHIRIYKPDGTISMTIERVS